MVSVKQQRGVVLLSVLVVSVVMVLLVAGAQTLISQRLEDAHSARIHLLEKAATRSQMATLVYLTSTQRVTPIGIGQGTTPESVENMFGRWVNMTSGDEIRADNHAYKKDINGVEVTYSVQAENGLIPINSADPRWLKQVLANSNVARFTVNRMIDSVADYADPDDWRRPSGAEHLQYKRRQSTTRNYLLQTCSELYLVANWQTFLSDHPSFMQSCSTRRTPTINVNAIPIQLLSLIWPDYADEIVRQRDDGEWLLDIRQAKASVPSLISVEDEYITIFGARAFMLTSSAGNYQERYLIKLGKREGIPFKLYQQPTSH